MLMMSANEKINGSASSSEIDVDDIPTKGGYVRSPVKVAAACGALVLAVYRSDYWLSLRLRRMETRDMLGCQLG